jgi:hypothetical protein
MTAETQTNTNVNPDGALLSGGPLGEHGKPMPREGDPHPELLDNNKSNIKYELNGKTFSSAEDMSKYVADLEKKVIEQPVFTQPQIPFKPVDQIELIDGQPIDQLLFTNPARAIQHIEDKASKKLDQKLQAMEDLKKFWSNFYSSNPDLRGKEEIVDALVSKNWGSWQAKSLPDFAKVAADTTRSALKKVGISGATEVESRDAATLGTSGNTITPAASIRRDTNLVDEMKEARIRRLKAKVR